MKTADWLDDLPKGWRGLGLKRVVSLSGQREVEPSPDEYYVGMENIESWTGRLLESDASSVDSDDEPESKSTSNRFSPGNVLFGKLRPYLAKVWLADRAGICSTELLVFQNGEKVHAPFLAHVLRTHEFIDAVDGTTFGSRMPRADWASIGDIPIPVPPFDHQRAIADHLDRETRRMDDLIAAKLRWLEVLAEKRVATISRAISEGAGGALSWSLSPLPWLERVPSHWTLRKLGYVSRIGNGSTPNRDNHDYWEGGHYPWLNSSFANDNEIFAADEFVTHLALDECHLPLVEPNSLLMGITGQGKTRGKCAILRFEATINQHLAYITPDTKVVSAEYLQHVLNSAYDFIRDESDGAGSTKGAITCEQIAQFKVPIPPLTEQRAIVAHIQTETAKIDALKTTTERSLALLRERRAALIAEAVTGKLSLFT